MNPSNGGWLIALTVFLGLILSGLHLPEHWPQWLGWLRPAWVVLVLFFWVLEVPHRVGLISAWAVGLLLDVLQADLLGLNGMVLAGVTYFTWKFNERIRMYSVLQQCSVVFAMVSGGELLRMLVQDFAFDRGFSWGPVSVAAVSAVLWPFVYLMLLKLRRQFRVE